MRNLRDDDKFKWPSGPLDTRAPEELLPIEEHLLLSTIQKLLEARNWDIEWLDIDLENLNINIDHPSITKKDAIEFFDELFETIGGAAANLFDLEDLEEEET